MNVTHVRRREAPWGALGAGARGVALVVVVAGSCAATAWLVGRAVSAVTGDRQEAWIVGRAAGITAYLLLVLLVALGLVMAHPRRAALRWPGVATRIRVHASLAAFSLAFVVLHVVVLATDSYAGVGWRGALLPMGATYRPVPVTLGVIGLWAGLLAGLTAALAGRWTGRVWWPVHKVAVVALVLVWVHGLKAGSDSRPLLALYLGTAVVVLALAWSRYSARGKADEVAQLAARRSGRTEGAVR